MFTNPGRSLVYYTCFGSHFSGIFNQFCGKGFSFWNLVDLWFFVKDKGESIFEAINPQDPMEVDNIDW